MPTKISQPDEHGYAYIHFDEHAHIRRTIPVSAQLDVDESGRVIGIELLDIPHYLTIKEAK